MMAVHPRWSIVMNPTPPTPAGLTAEEWQARVHLAAGYRLIALHGWDDLVFTHISLRVPGPEEHFLINPYGMLFEEITASSLVKVNARGEKVSDSPYPVNPAGFLIHSAIHAARPDVHCVLHTHTRDGVAVSAQAEGLLPLSQQSIFPLASMATHDYEGVVLHEAEQGRLIRDLGDAGFLLLRNHGLLVAAGNMPDAFLMMYTFETACQIQVRALSGGVPVRRVPQAIVEGAKEMAKKNLLNLGGMLAWPGLLRKLDRVNPGYAA
jgi:ribulose-5-phosphate 4-epimerase/fuculose-1-phosphate aldolase